MTSAYLSGVPRTVDDLTASWLSDALRPTWPGIVVRGVEIVEVLHGTATKVRLIVDHNLGDALPIRLCLKAGLGDHAMLMASTGIYANEARFFAEVRDPVRASAPRWWWAGVEDSSQLGAVLMEDLARPGVRFCKVTEPLNIDEVDRALGALAALHSASFGRLPLGRWPWLPFSVVEPGPSAAYFRTLGPEVIAAELAKPGRGAAVPSELHDPQRVVDGFWRWVTTNREGPFALLHGDAHVGNLYIDGQSPGYCDWQTVRFGRPTFDVAYFIGSALTVADRRSAERDLLASYRDRLAAMAQAVPSLDDLWLDYRRDMTYGFFAWLTNLEVFQPEEVNVASIERFSTAVLDLESADAVGCRGAVGVRPGP